MLTKLLPEQVSKFWDIIKYAIEESLPPIAGENPDRMNRILTAALSGSVICWASYTREEGTSKFEGILITKLLYDDVSDTRNLLIYCIYGYESVSDSSWLDGLKSILKYAASKRCNQIIAYTTSPYIVKLVNDLGGDSSYNFISFNVNESVKSFNELGD